MIISPNDFDPPMCHPWGTSPGQLEAWKMRTRLELLEDGVTCGDDDPFKNFKGFYGGTKKLGFYGSILDILENVRGKQIGKGYGYLRFHMSLNWII